MGVTSHNFSLFAYVIVYIKKDLVIVQSTDTQNGYCQFKADPSIQLCIAKTVRVRNIGRKTDIMTS